MILHDGDDRPAPICVDGLADHRDKLHDRRPRVLARKELERVVPVERPEVDWLLALEINHPYEIAASDAESVPASGRNMTTVPNLLHHRDLVKVKEAVYLF